MTTSTATQPYEAALAAKPLNDVKQQILLLYLGGSDLGSQVIGWTLYDGTDRYNYDNNESDDPIYKTGLDALRAGWQICNGRRCKIPIRLTETSPGFSHSSLFLSERY